MDDLDVGKLKTGPIEFIEERSCKKHKNQHTKNESE